MKIKFGFESFIEFDFLQLESTLFNKKCICLLLFTSCLGIIEKKIYFN